MINSYISFNNQTVHLSQFEKYKSVTTLLIVSYILQIQTNHDKGFQYLLFCFFFGLLMESHFLPIIFVNFSAVSSFLYLLNQIPKCILLLNSSKSTLIEGKLQRDVKQLKFNTYSICYLSHQRLTQQQQQPSVFIGKKD